MHDLEVARVRRLDLGDDLVLVAERALHHLDAGLFRVWLESILVDRVLNRSAPAVEADFRNRGKGPAHPRHRQSRGCCSGGSQSEERPAAEIAVDVALLQPFESIRVGQFHRVSSFGALLAPILVNLCRINPPTSGMPTVMTIMTVPSALISGLIDILSIES